MCALCDILIDGPHWTETGTNVGNNQYMSDSRSLYLERFYRLKVLNYVLKPYGAVAEDWSGGQYIVRNLAGGASDVAPNLPALWKSLEFILNRRVDPLSKEFLSEIEKIPV